MRIDIIDFVIQWQEGNDISNSEMARKLKISKPEYYQIIRNKKYLTDEQLDKLSVIVGQDLRLMLVDKPWQQYFNQEQLRDILDCADSHSQVLPDTVFAMSYYRSLIGRLVHILMNKEK